MARTWLNPLPAPPGDGPDAIRGRCACADAPTICPRCFAAWLRATHEAELELWLAEWDEPDEEPTLPALLLGTDGTTLVSGT